MSVNESSPKKAKTGPLTLYHALYASSSPVLQALEEIGAADKVHVKKITMEEAKEDQFRRITPLGKIPALVDEGTGEVTLESLAIAQKLLDRLDTAGKILPPVGDARRYKTLEAALFALTHIYPAIDMLCSSKDCSDDIKEFAVSKLLEGRVLDHVEDLVRDRTWVLGDELSLGDLFLGYSLMGCVHSTKPIKGLEAPGVKAFCDRFAALPSSVKIFELESDTGNTKDTGDGVASPVGEPAADVDPAAA